MDDPDEKIGYGNPPKTNRFKESGNMTGRPKGSKNRKTIVREIANEMHRVPGKDKRRSTLDLILLRLRHLALEDKNLRAIEELHRLLKIYQPEADREGVGYIVAPAEISPEEWAEEQERKNLTRKPPPGIKDKPYE